MVRWPCPQPTRPDHPRGPGRALLTRNPPTGPVHAEHDVFPPAARARRAEDLRLDGGDPRQPRRGRGVHAADRAEDAVVHRARGARRGRRLPAGPGCPLAVGRPPEHRPDAAHPRSQRFGSVRTGCARHPANDHRASPRLSGRCLDPGHHRHRDPGTAHRRGRNGRCGARRAQQRQSQPRRGGAQPGAAPLALQADDREWPSGGGGRPPAVVFTLDGNQETGF